MTLNERHLPDAGGTIRLDVFTFDITLALEKLSNHCHFHGLYVLSKIVEVLDCRYLLLFPVMHGTYCHNCCGILILTIESL